MYHAMYPILGICMYVHCNIQGRLQMSQKQNMQSCTAAPTLLCYYFCMLCHCATAVTWKERGWHAWLACMHLPMSIQLSIMQSSCGSWEHLCHVSRKEGQASGYESAWVGVVQVSGASYSTSAVKSGYEVHTCLDSFTLCKVHNTFQQLLPSAVKYLQMKAVKRCRNV